MRTRVIDLREYDIETAGDRLISFLKINQNNSVVIIGHGNKQGEKICGVDAESLPLSEHIKIVWLYSCNSAKKLAEIVVKKYNVVLGFSTEVVALNNVMPTEVQIFIEILLSMDNVVDDIYTIIRKELEKTAKNELSLKNLLNAVIINHTRLSLRCIK